MEPTKSFNKKYLIAGIILVIVVVLLLVFSLQKSDNSILPLGKNNIENTLDVQIVLDVSSIDTTFVPVENKDLILEGATTITPELAQVVEARIKENETKRLALTEESSLADKLNIHFMLSADYKTLGQYGKAKEMLEKALEIDNRNSNLMQVYSSLLDSMGDKNSALLYINKAIALYPKEVGYWLWKIDLEKSRGVSTEKLIEVYEQAITMTEKNQDGIVMYARFLEENGMKTEALAKWEELKTLKPENINLYQIEINRLNQN